MDAQFSARQILVKAYYHTLVAPFAMPSTAITIVFCMFYYLRMPFGLRNAAHTFQCFVYQMLRPLILLRIPRRCSCLQNLSRRYLGLLFRPLNDDGVIISTAKYEFGVENVYFLGRHVDGHRILPLNVQGVRDASLSRTQPSYFVNSWRS